uniref:Uncharacterized protein n=1 Tax=Oryza brachyantha TaxID=4533 RepID=J3LY58_ORYBR
MACSDAGGMRNEPPPSAVSMALPCCTENVCSCASTVLKTMVHAKMGVTARSVFACCTSATVHARHGRSGFVFGACCTALTHALSKNLQTDFATDQSVTQLQSNVHGGAAPPVPETRSSPEFAGVAEVAAGEVCRLANSGIGRIGGAGRADLLPLGVGSNKHLQEQYQYCHDC